MTLDASGAVAMFSLRNLTSQLLVLVWLPLLVVAPVRAGGVARPMDPQLQEEYCKNFTYGNGRTEFFSPGFPRHYPAGIKCFRTISADYGYFVRVDFRDFFHIEPPTNEGNCDYDYLEVSEGRCSNTFPLSCIKRRDQKTDKQMK